MLVKYGYWSNMLWRQGSGGRSMSAMRRNFLDEIGVLSRHVPPSLLRTHAEGGRGRSGHCGVRIDAHPRLKSVTWIREPDQ